jgi:inhibitor of cysteine peptidase
MKSRLFRDLGAAGMTRVRTSGASSVIALAGALVVLLAFTLACGSDTPGDNTGADQTGSTAEGTTVPASLTLSETDDGGSFEIQAGGTIELSLQANPSTGFAWEMDDPDPEASLLEQVGDPVFISDNPDAAGAGGTVTYTFRAVDRGEMVVRMVYYPPDPTMDPTDSFQIDLTVK